MFMTVLNEKGRIKKSCHVYSHAHVPGRKAPRNRR